MVNTFSTQSQKPTRSQVAVHLGAQGIPLGELGFVRQGRRQFSVFSYSASWLAHPARFGVSPDLPLAAGFQTRKAAMPGESVFHAAIADTAPDVWGRRVIERHHAKARRNNPALPALSELDYLCAVDDESRMGALRLKRDGRYLSTAEPGQRSTPPFIELERLYAASRAVETDQETAQDLAYLLGRGTSLGGMRPKCTILDEDGHLAIGKFPSVSDGHEVTRAEVLALRLAAMAGIRAALARCVSIGGVSVAIIRRFDRTEQQERIPYLSAASLIGASRDEDRAYTEIVDALRSVGSEPVLDARELWRRLVFNLLITNTDDHLHNTGFLYDGCGRWRLAPAFDLNPMPGKLRESKTWLSEDTGPIDSMAMLLDQCVEFALSREEALQIHAQIQSVISQWRTVAMSREVGLNARELEPLAQAFEHPQIDY
ncbi:MAG: type II toxin-antitoxin system HipA family toxin [Brachymonas sp.]|nr:type II toxin-antitoxin system HipA family toxin [Brachymonas sp.]